MTVQTTEIDFEGKDINGGTGNVPDINEHGDGGTNEPGKTGEETGKQGDGADKGDEGGKGNDSGGDEGGKKGEGDDKGDGGDDNHSSTGELEPGTIIEFGDDKYTVDKDGNIVDDKGNIFKEKKDVAEWLKSMQVEDKDKQDLSNKDISVKSLQEALGITVTDEEGKPVEFTEDAEGVKSYVNSVIELKTKEIQEGTLNKLFADNPMLKQFIDYVHVTGSPRGFGELPDRSGIKLDKDNATQQEYIIRMAAQEFNNKSIDDTFIKYLKDSNGLYDYAKAQLANLVEKDKKVRADIEQRAAANKAAKEAEDKQYWDNVKSIVESGKFADFTIPETIIKEVNGKKTTYNRSDFFNYMNKFAYKDEDGNMITGYQRDLNAMSDKDYLERQILDAYLLFKGATYKSLGELAAKEDKVRTLQIKAKEQGSARTVKITPKSQGKVDPNDILF